MERRYACQYIAGVCSLLLLSPLAAASEIEKWLIMPGPVVSSHADIEADCAACHTPLDDQPQSDLCIICHTEVGKDIASQSGFHGRLPEDEQLQCASCHTDHEGRDMDIVDLDEDDFDHRLTDFRLVGAHTTLACIDCHTGDMPHRAAPNECVDCHKNDDVHAGSLGPECGTCHNSDTWQDAQFDHDLTRFSLTGAHAVVACDACHLSSDFSQVGQSCVDCHGNDDVHNGRNGTQCADCHSTKDWTSVDFNHMLVANFALVGGHKGLDCQACHRADDFKDLGGSTCNSCHERDDPHKGRFGSDCASCHNNFNWDTVLFDHDAKTGFALPTGHRELACKACHTRNLTDPLPRECGTCHADDDVHEGQLGDQCLTCHVSTSWTAPLWFDHDLTTFPLVGAHAEVDCESCHATAAFHDADSTCVSCHADDDPHGGSLGNECDDCHNPSDWRAWQFDHDDQTDFSLTGAHVNLACDACHIESTDVAIPGDCNSCHRRDDPHFGRFGNNCESCHTTSSFSQIEGM